MADLIDRQEAIRIVRELKTVHFDGMETYETGRNDAIEVIAGVLLKEMPSAESKMPEWAQAVERMYNKALCKPCINNPLAWALYQVWREYDK